MIPRSRSASVERGADPVDTVSMRIPRARVRLRVEEELDVTDALRGGTLSR